ncbi:related to F-box protein HRT3 [Saccharomycodes ludwigii]|uniref:Related to F-box protein HRT3 n=1 Tax=Saccharomycodes ludwigii TaxID=36035 RepID=A0A376B2A2_9ASCO|nr:related to F-box protein HRT3 [Saccharomycodes ludwigii]
MNTIHNINNNTSALQLWENGISKETTGSMMDAIRFYRQALKLNPNIEKVYREKIRTEYEIEKKFKDNLTLTSDQNALVAGEETDQIEENTTKDAIVPCFILDMLPPEILSQIIGEVIKLSSESWVNLSLSCHMFNRLCFSHKYATFSFLVASQIIYKKQVYSYDIFHTLSPIEQVEFNKVLNEQYTDNYYRMLQDRPFIKFEGVYISVNNYLRYGAIPEGSSSLLNPIHMITYYRYLRFYPDGTCLRLVSPIEPSVMTINNLHKTEDSSSIFKDLAVCKWSINTEMSDMVTIIRYTKKYTFVEKLRIRNQGLKIHHKLKWIESFALDTTSGEKSVFNLKTEKPFFFSRVRSYVSGG